ncbi:MAG: hypothetical protein LBM69_02980 [Lachnospiraceae bacterium]|nr:hypothetical protein [Lachnospiraceae bacterium]
MNISSMLSSGMDYSGLFGSLGSAASSVAGSTFLSDWYSIKNGSTYRLYKAHYAEQMKSEETDETDTKKTTKSNSKNSTTSGNTTETETKATASTSISKDSTEKLSGIIRAADDLKAATDAFSATGSKSLFAVAVQKSGESQTNNVTTTENTAQDVLTQQKGKIVNALSTFVDRYNSLLSAIKSTSNTAITNGMDRMIHATKTNENLLGKIGVTIQADNTVSLDKTKFETADVQLVKDLFTGYGSYGSQTSSQTAALSRAAQREAAKAATYTEKATYSAPNTAGSVFEDLF